jgi:pyruvate,orthophosphate dikinase
MSDSIFPFGDGATPDPRGLDPAVVGGKGAALAEMASIGLPVPPGFTIATDACSRLRDAGDAPADLRHDVTFGLDHIERLTGKVFGSPANPLLVSVRSGARASMPGMMDTVLNLGLNDETVEGLAALSGDARFAWDSYRRFIQIYGDVVLGIDYGLFDEALEIAKEGIGFCADIEMTSQDWQPLVDEYKSIILAEAGQPFPQDPQEQLWGAIRAVCHSWNSDRARTYRRLQSIPDHWGTAVTVQAMVFGNRSDDSATGVAFTRDPKSGERALFGEYLPNAQGEDVVSGVRTPHYLTRAARDSARARASSMEEAMPDVFGELQRVAERLEQHFRDMQDIEFTVEQGRLWLLQSRSGKRGIKAALRIAVEMEREGLIDRNTAVMRIDPMALDQLLHPTLDLAAPRDVLARGLPASPGAATGVIVLDAHEAERREQLGDAVILVRSETSPEDIGGMHAARGILTARGGMTSHAAVVARGMGRPCVSGASALSIDMNRRVARIGNLELPEGSVITLDGTKGEVLAGAVPVIEPELVGDFATVMEWADASRRMRVRVNADTPEECRLALQFGAEGVGLCRTEHMFFDNDRIAVVRRMILADKPAQRREALAVLLPLQRQDFRELFEVMAGLPVTIRLLDPPLHEFLPRGEADYEELSDALGIGIDTLRRRARELQESNPLLGHRGCRLGISIPEIYEMQVRAVLEAACEMAEGWQEVPIPEFLIPFASGAREVAILRERIDRIAQTVFAAAGRSITYRVGAMIEVPRAIIQARNMAEEVEFFSFGTNDLTQTTLGISRDDGGRFIGQYVDHGIYRFDPFITIDRDGVGELVRLASERGRSVRPGLPLGICGEHGGDPGSIAFFEEVGLDYVSASPYRIPISRLAAAQAVIAATR